MSLIHALPAEWKQWLRNGTASHEMLIPKFQFAMQNHSIVSAVYKSFHTHVYLLQNKWQKWETIFQVEIWPVDFLKVVNSLWNISRNSKLRSFQCRLLTSAVITNVQLKQWRIVESDLCSFCKTKKETIVHLLCECHCTGSIWQLIQHWCKLMNIIDVEFSHQKIIFNNVSPVSNSVINTIVLIAKFYIYRTRCFREEPNAIEFKKYLLWHHKMELIGAKVAKRSQKHHDKWQNAITVIKY